VVFTPGASWRSVAGAIPVALEPTMKAVLVPLAAVLAVTAPAAAAQTPDEVLDRSLVAATRRAIDLAPWVKVTVANVTAGDKLEWVARTGAGQRYACSAPASADALLAGAKAACTRLKADSTGADRLSGAAELYNQTQRARIPFPGQYSESGGN
jgi:hypothetical protein